MEVPKYEVITVKISVAMYSFVVYKLTLVIISHAHFTTE